jgi:ligand-binding sensor domain-containing protein
MPSRRLVLALLSIVTTGRAETLAIRTYTVADGLAHNHVSRIYRDSQDYLWICTDEGLSRFDGRGFVNYTTADGLPHIHVNDIVETRSGNYWVGTDGGITLFQPRNPTRRFRTFKPDGPPQALFTNAVLEEPDGAVLLGTAAGLYRMRVGEGGSPRFERIEFGSPAGVPESSSINTIRIDAKGNLWIGAVSGLYRRDSSGIWTRFTTREGLPHDFVDRIETDRDRRLWVCTRHGLGRVTANPQAGKPALDLILTNENGLPDRDVRAVYFTTDGRRWIGTLGGLVEWDPSAPAASALRTYSYGRRAQGPVDLGDCDRSGWQLLAGVPARRHHAAQPDGTPSIW